MRSKSHNKKCAALKKKAKVANQVTVIEQQINNTTVDKSIHLHINFGTSRSKFKWILALCFACVGFGYSLASENDFWSWFKALLLLLIKLILQ